MTPPAPSRPADPPAATVNGILTSGLARACYYAGSRPGCQVLASVRYGPVALCAPCDQRRSTLGKGTAPAALPEPDALLEIAATSNACQQATSDLRRAVAAARQAGHPWSAVAAILGGSRQAAQQRFANSPDAASGAAGKAGR
jgi:hypothetical protein